MHRLEVGAADVGTGQLAVHPPLLRQEGGPYHRIATRCRTGRQPLLETGQPAGHVGLLLVDGKQHGSVAQHPGAGLSHIHPHPAEVGHAVAVHQPALHVDVGSQHGADVGTTVAAAGGHLERQPAVGRLGERCRQIQPHSLQVGVERQLEAERLIVWQGQPQAAGPVAAPLEDGQRRDVLALATAVPLPLELEIDLIAIGLLAALVVEGERLVPQARLEVAETGLLVVILEPPLHLLQWQIQAGDPHLVVAEQGVAAGLDLALAIQRNIQLNRALHGAADLHLPQRLTDRAAERRVLQIVADGLALALNLGIHVEVGPRVEIRDPGVHRVGAGLAEPGSAAVHVEAGVLEQQIDLQVGKRLPTGEEFVGGLLERYRHLEDALALAIGEVAELAIPEQVSPLGLAPLDGPAQIVHQTLVHHLQRIVAIGVGRILDVDAAGQGEEGVLEQLEPKAAGEAQIRVVQHQILAIEHPALRHLPPVEPRREAIDGDRLLEVTGRVYGIVCQLQPGAAAGRSEPELAVEIAHAGHVAPGVDPDVGELAADGEPLPAGIRLQDQILNLAGRAGAFEGLGQFGIDPRHQLAQVGDLVQIDGRHIALDAIADSLELQPAVQPGLAVELEGDVVAGKLPLLAVPAQLDLAPLQPEPVQVTLFFFILPDQVVVAKRQQRVPQLAGLELAPELEVELAAHLGLPCMGTRQHGADVELAGPQIELALELVEPHLGGIHVDDEVEGALAHPVDEVGLADPLVALAAVLPAQLGDVEGPHLPQRRGEAEAGVMNIEGGELGQQKAQQGLLLVAAVAGFRLRRLT